MEKKKVQRKLFLYFCFKIYLHINLNLIQSKSAHIPSLMIFNAQQISKYLFLAYFYFFNQGTMNDSIFP